MKEVTKLGNRTGYSSQYDPSQLECFPRASRRRGYTAPMYGFDIWTCFEVSFLDLDGVPEFHVLRIINPASSENIFESKSLKLYLNSFNNTKFQGLEEVMNLITKDLSERVKSPVKVVEVKRFSLEKGLSGCIDSEIKGIPIEDYHYKPELLRCDEVTGQEAFHSNLLRSNCEVTNQPDWARIIVSYCGPKKLDHISFLKYIISYRDHQEFHEPTCERIYNDLYKLLTPYTLNVTCQYTRRGGIDINPLRSNLELSSQQGEDILYNLPKILQQ